MRTLTNEQMVAALLEAAQATTAADETTGRTFDEWRRDTGMSENKLRAALAEMQRAGRLRVGRRLVPDLTGRPNARPTYFLTE